jgi:hypothetical protein
MKTISILLAGMTLLTGCAETVYKTRLEVYCPPLINYSDDFNNNLADELTELPEFYTAIPVVVIDYIKLRDDIRRCEEEKGKL